MRFIADAMLGRLAKWLRILGFDVLYYPVIDDRLVIKISREQERTILTRDTRLVKQRGLRSPILIESNNIFDQLLEIKDRLDFRGAAPPGRCTACNGTLSSVSQKLEIKEFVPDFIYHNFNDFIKCEDCGKVYWEGTHREKIRQKVKEIFSTPSELLRRQGRN